MRKLIAILFALSLGGCASVVGQLQQGTIALSNFNTALITLDITIVNNLKAQAQQLAPLVCGAVSLGNTMAAQPGIAAAVNGLLKTKQAQTTAGRILVTATSLCQAAGLSTTVTAVPPAAVASGS